MRVVTALVLALLLAGCGREQRVRAAIQGVDDFYAELGGLMASLDALDLRHFVYSVRGVCFDPDAYLLRQLRPETREAYELFCEQAIRDLPEVYLIRRGAP